MKETKNGMTYAGTGVDYDAMDPFKRMAQAAGRQTADNIKRFGMTEAEMSRGESAYLVETPDAYLAHVEEGLGTKILVADAMRKLTYQCYYDNIAQDTVAMIANDMATLGALPISVAMHLAVGDSNWFVDETRCGFLVAGWKKACHKARAVWGGGETPTLRDIVAPSTAVLAGSAMGIVKPKNRLLSPDKIRHGDAIVLLASSGIHANGLTLARRIAEKLPDGYLTRLSNGRTYGETLLDPTYIYVPIVEDCLNRGVKLHYAVNITGHGWRKLMRAPQPFTYVIEKLPPTLPIFDFIQMHGPVDNREAYGNLNMGAGFALYMPRSEVRKFAHIMQAYDYTDRIDWLCAGHIERSTRREVVIGPKDLAYGEETLAVR
jgi:phosphoribosylformylglycinamidine cyclo-ligase